MSIVSPDTCSQLYEEAEDVLPVFSRELTEELCPLYHALGRIEVRYSERELIGQGGMKNVQSVYDQRTERRVALAQPKEGIPVARYDAFLREAHITARLEHPNIIKLFDMGIDEEDYPFFTMELKTGLSLRKILSGLCSGKDLEKYPYGRRLSIALRVCDAMSYAHSRRVLHLDLKPENIQVGNFGEVQVCDWGVGEVERGETEEHLDVALLDPDLYGDQLESVVKGTPGYMAPEQEDSRSTKSAQTDIHALGCLLYELATLQSPSKKDQSPPESRALAAIVEKACAVEASARYVSVNAMMDDIRRHLAGFSPKAETTGFFREARRFYRRNRQPCLLTFCFSALLLGAGAWFTQQLRESYSETSFALGETEEALENAQVALAKLEKEKGFSLALLDQATEGTVEETPLLFHLLMMDEEIGLNTVENFQLFLDRSLEKNPAKGNPMWTQKGYTLFMTQQFSEAAPYYRKRSGKQGDLLKIIPDFAPLVQRDGLLSPPDFIKLLNKIGKGENNRNELIEKMLIYDGLTRNSPRAQGQIIKAVLALTNPKWSEQVFEYDPKRRHLRIGGKGLKSLFRPLGSYSNETRGQTLCLLRLMNLRSLDLRGSELASLEYLNGLNLDELDLRGVPLSDLESLRKMASLKKIIFHEGQVDEQQLRALSKTVSVFYKE